MFEEPDDKLTWPIPVFLTEAGVILEGLRCRAGRRARRWSCCWREAFVGAGAVGRFRAGEVGTDTMPRVLFPDAEAVSGAQS